MTRTAYIGALAAIAVAAGAATAHANAWFPLKAGTTYVYKGKDGKHHARDVVKITHRTRVIQGVRCTVIDDRVYLDGRLAEKTRDYYAEDSKGNVRYYGEDTAELNRNGHVTSREGSWHAGVHGARSGLYMPAHPKAGRGYRYQEFYRGHAEDKFRIVRVRNGTLITHERTRLEPGVLDEKRYKRGVGQISEDSLKGGDEHLHLVAVRHGG
jgi:hypothetical protein